MKARYLFALLFVAASSALYAQTSQNGLVFTPISDTDAAVSLDAHAVRTADVTIPETVTINGQEYTVTSIADNAFLTDKDLVTIHFPNTLRHIGKNAFAGCTALKGVEFPESLETIGSNAFHSEGGAGIESLTIPGKVSEIGDSAFRSAPIETLIIQGDSSSPLLTLGKDTFGGTRNAIKDIYISRTTPPAAETSTFKNGDYSGTTLIVFGDAIPYENLYKTAPVWKLFTQPIITSVDMALADKTNAKSEYFTLGGVYLVNNPEVLRPGAYVVRTDGGKASVVYRR
ncbi:MAG: leucine-rich repeat domain-containing protein [Muribaculaceae bacterium]|nr:leucine-rich repeat domain-containing protein [Muribaculaceae bacterium]